MTTIHFIDLVSDDVGEVQGFLSADGELLHMWSTNDANYRGEYIDPLLRALGYEIDHSGQFEERFEQLARERFGF